MNGPPTSHYSVVMMNRDGLQAETPRATEFLEYSERGKAAYMGKGNREPGFEQREVRVMRTAETVLQIIRDRGKRGLLLEEDVYRQLFNPHLYLLAYSRIYKNDGALTQGMTEETADGMSLQKIEKLYPKYSVRTLPMDASPTGPNSQEKRENATARDTHLVRQTGPRGHQAHPGSLLRTTIL